MNNQNIDTWLTNEKEENLMFDDHYPMWQVMIDRMSESNLQDKTVLDFGCNQGGFLPVLYQRKPFKMGIGIDVAKQAIEIANENNKNLPLIYEVRDNLSHLSEEIDVAFSHEVLYLLGNLEQHAKEVFSALKHDGVYYASLGCHTDNPLWSKWKKILERQSNIEIKNYSLNFIAKTFQKNGFHVFAQKFMLNNFILIEEESEYFSSVADHLNYYWDYKILWKFKKREQNKNI